MRYALNCAAPSGGFATLPPDPSPRPCVASIFQRGSPASSLLGGCNPVVLACRLTSATGLRPGLLSGKGDQLDMHAADICQTPQFTYLGRLTTVIAALLVEAMALANEENFGRKYAEIVCHTRELYNELLEELVIAGPSGDELARGLTESIGLRLDGLERQIAPVAERRPQQSVDTMTLALPLAASSKPAPRPPNDRAELWHVWR
jgi:hypothetical protein